MFDVYVVGANEAGEEGLDKLAETMASRYGAPLEDLRGRLARGRFRVKANVDRATADAYVKDITSIGGRCLVESASTAPNQSIPPPIGPLPARTSTTTTPPAGTYQSGLSAAFSGSHIPAADLGALGREDAYSLASLDGHDDHHGKLEAFSPPLAAASPRGGAAAAPAPAKAPRPRDVPVELDSDFSTSAPTPIPLDPFRPPDAQEEVERPMEIAADELEHRARRRMSTPPMATPIPEATSAQVTSPPLRRSSPSVSPMGTPTRPTPMPGPVAIVRAPGRLGPLGDDRVRFALGVLIAVLLGFVPAHVITSIRERAAYHAIDASVEQVQRDATAQEEYDALDAFRARQLDDKRAAQRNLILVAFAIWGAAAGAVALGWFKAIPWDRLDAPRTT